MPDTHDHQAIVHEHERLHVTHYDRPAEEITHEISTTCESSTEDMRQGMIHYRPLFEELLEVDRASGPRA